MMFDLKWWIVMLFISGDIYCVLSGDCCRPKDPKAKPNPCASLTKINDCLALKNFGTCEWFCYLEYDKEATTKLNNLKKRSKPKKVETTETGEKEYEFAVKEVEALKAMDDTKYYKAYSLLTYDAKGDAKIFKYSDSNFVKQDQVLFAWDKKIMTNWDTYFKKTKPSMQTCSAMALKQSGTLFYPKCESFFAIPELNQQQTIDNMGRRLMEDEPDLQDPFFMDEFENARRRLARGDTGAETELATATTAQNGGSLPYQATGLLRWKRLKANGNLGGFAGTGAVIRSVKEGLHNYEYILTCGHNCYSHEARGAALDPLVTQMKFYKGYNANGARPADGVATHAWADLKRIWVPLYKGAGNDLFPNDYCVIKYKVNNLGTTVMKTSSASLRDRLRLVTYRLGPNTQVPVVANPYRMRKVIKVEPFRGGGDLYEANYYTRKGMSGSPLFIEGGDGVTTSIVVAVHVGKNHGGTHSVHNRLTRAKIDTIDKIIMNKWDAHADVSQARIGYEDMIYHYSHKNYAENSYQDIDDEQDEDENEDEYGFDTPHYANHRYKHKHNHIEDHLVNNYPNNSNYHETEQWDLLYMVFIVISVIIIGCLCCAFGTCFGTCFGGGMFHLYQTYIVKNNKYNVSKEIEQDSML